MSEHQHSSVSEEITLRPTLRGILLWCGSPNPDDDFVQKGLEGMIDRYAGRKDPTAADWKEAREATAIFAQREGFEHWWNVRHSDKTWGLEKDPKGEYIYLHAELAWQAWQEASKP